MKIKFTGFNNTVTALMDLIDSCSKWTIAELPALPTWVSSNRRVTLVGDACHAMAPNVGQGAGMAIEDAEVLGLCIAKCASVDEFPKAMAAYQAIRKARCERAQEVALEVGGAFSLPDGPMQAMRDKMLAMGMDMIKKQVAGEMKVPIHQPDMSKKYPDPQVIAWLYGHDVVTETTEYLEKHWDN
jgi:salicylate hydroxylase